MALLFLISIVLLNYNVNLMKNQMMKETNISTQVGLIPVQEWKNLLLLLKAL